ncbi:hypothetical protein [Neorhizobium sp. AL 9.2.2]|uniref:hypothetical protein n=1 Tax=Neorhizobium sp. AL 9.2.2 TaxID=2712894 RepID=UPI001574C327|nr:hypothetical protein [Neorhizobium sp. AL 9.2.2]NSY17267.1 hypothetical protein [Neorhizobium sp. AL 9.2.2]
MPKMPGADQLGVARPQPNTRIASADLSAVGRGAQQLGQGIRSLGSDIAEIGQENRQQRGTTEISGANAFYADNILSSERTIKDSGDYSSFGKTFDTQAGKILQDGAKLIADPTYREKWIADKQVDLANRRQSILGAADNRRNEAYQVNLGNALEKDQNIFTDPATPEADKQASMARINDSIAAAEQTGLLKPAQAQQWRDTYAKGGILKEAELKILNDPGFRKEVISGSGAAVSGGVIDRIIGVESGGNATAKNPNSSATGAGQFIASTWMNMVKQYRPDLAEGRSANEVLQLRNDPALSREMTKRYSEENASFLRNQGVEATDGNIYLAHFLGPRGAAQVLKADPNASVESVVGDGVVNANGFLRGKNVSDLIAWSNKKMGGASNSSTSAALRQGNYATLAPEDRQKLYQLAERTQNQYAVEQRGVIADAVENAPIAIQNTGTYTGNLPTQDQFLEAFGADEGVRKYDAFKTSVDTSQQVYNFQTMPAEAITQAVAAARPTSTGDDAALEQSKYQVLERAGAEVVKAREADPASYVQQAFPAVRQAWSDASTSGDFRAAMSASIAAQQQLGIQNVQPLPKEVAGSALDSFKKPELSDEDRLNSVAGLVFSTSDPQQRQAVFGQLLKAGLPPTMQGAMEASARGDTGAAYRLMQASIVDPAKLPKSGETKPREVDEAIYAGVWAPGEIGDAAYGTTYGDASSLERATVGTELLRKAALIRVSQGQDVDTAVEGAKKDLFGDMTVFSGSGSVTANLPIPKDIDQQKLADGLEASKASFKAAIEARRSAVMDGANSKVADGSKAVIDAATTNRAADIVDSGIFVPVGNGIGMRDPYTGAFVSGPDGNPLTLPLDRILQMGGTVQSNTSSGGRAPLEITVTPADAAGARGDQTRQEMDQQNYGTFSDMLPGASE